MYGVAVDKRLAKNFSVHFFLQDAVTRSYICLKAGFSCPPGLGPQNCFSLVQAMTSCRILVGMVHLGWAVPMLELFSLDLGL